MRPATILLLVAAGGVATTREIRADDAGASARRMRPLARVGPATITVGDLEDRIAALAPFQRIGLGDTADAVRRHVLNDVLIHDELLALEAAQEKLEERPPAAYETERALSAATIRALRAAIGPAAAIPDEDVQRYYDEHRARYDTPARYHLWRILCGSRDEAQAVLDAAKRDATPSAFEALAREHSLDKATNLRSGNLGFVHADGTSNEPGLRVDPAIVRAALGVEDGSLVPEPVPEGDHFSVVWRRGTVGPTKRTVGEVAAQIRDTLWKGRVKERTAELVSALRAARLRDLDASPLATMDIPTSDERPWIGDAAVARTPSR